MSTPQTPTVGTIAWRDLTVPDAVTVQDFYCKVVGWTAMPHSRGDYNDYVIQAPGVQEAVAGICHARGTNANLPPQWLMYVHVADVDASARKCIELGGRVLDGPRELGRLRLCVIQDPAGAVLAIVA